MGAPRGGRGQERGAPLGASLIDIITANEGGRGALGSRFTPPSSPPCLSFPSPPVGTRGDVTAPPVPRPRAAGWGRGWLSPGVTRGVTRLTCLGTGSENELITPEEGFVPPHGGGLGFGDALVAPPWRPPVWWHRLGVTRCGRDRGVSPPRGGCPHPAPGRALRVSLWDPPLRIWGHPPKLCHPLGGCWGHGDSSGWPQGPPGSGGSREFSGIAADGALGSPVGFGGSRSPRSPPGMSPRCPRQQNQGTGQARHTRGTPKHP